MNIIEHNLNFFDMSVRSVTNCYILHHLEAEGANWTVEAIHAMHQEKTPQFGFAGIGYHFYIRLDGSVHRGRPEKYIGSHCKGANSDSIGVAFEGDYDKRTEMPAVQYNAWVELKAYLDGEYGTLPAFGHREKGSSECPGRYFPLDKCKSAQGGVYSVGWHQNETGWWYCTDERGYYYTADNGWQQIDGDWFVFDAQGYALHDQWIKHTDGKWYYLKHNCVMAKSEWVHSPGGWYYVNEIGALVANKWEQDKYQTHWYYLGADGTMVSNKWITDSGKNYYVNANGEMQVNTTVDNRKLGPDGAEIV
jgi:glucan-binding YG repeat protein